MECAGIYNDACDGPVVFRRTDPVARKQHMCNECKRTIEPGETYTMECGRWEDYWATYKTCADCLSLRNIFFEGGWMYTEIVHNVREHVSDLGGAVPGACIEGLTQTARDAVFKMMDAVILDSEEDW